MPVHEMKWVEGESVQQHVQLHSTSGGTSVLTEQSHTNLHQCVT